MKRPSLLATAAVAAALLFPTRVSATLLDFTDYELGGTTASWDIFYGANYLPVFTFDTGTVGNPIINSLEPLTLRATVTTWMAGPPAPHRQQATGPIGNDNQIPGDREQFYTFFGNVNWDITETWDASWNTFVFQARVATGSNTSMASVLFNGLAPTQSGFDTVTGVGTWRWDGLSLADDSTYALTWNTGTHTGLDAFQIQAGVIPEPSTWALIALAGVAWIFRRRFRRVS